MAHPTTSPTKAHRSQDLHVRVAGKQREWVDKVHRTHNIPRSEILRYAISLLIQTYGDKTDDLVEDVAAELHDLRRARGRSRGERRGS